MNKNQTYITLDTIRLVTNSKYLLSLDDSLFKHTFDPSTGEVLAVEFKSKMHQDLAPFGLYILVNYRAEKLTLEFSSKLLFEDYAQLISIDTLPNCLNNIEKLGICTFDINMILNDSYINKVHVTKDVDLQLTPKILDRLNRCTGEFRRYSWKTYDSCISFKKDVKAPDCKEELTIYDKELEIGLPKNKAFLDKTGCPEIILKHFEGKTRFEVKYENKQRIKKTFGITDTSIQEVLTTDRNIVLNQFNRIFNNKEPPVDTTVIANITDYGLLNTIRHHNGDLKKIEQEIKDIGIYGSASRGARNRQMVRIKKLAEAYSNQDDGNSILEEIRNKLKD